MIGVECTVELQEILGELVEAVGVFFVGRLSRDEHLQTVQLLKIEPVILNAACRGVIVGSVSLQVGGHTLFHDGTQLPCTFAQCRVLFAHGAFHGVPDARLERMPADLVVPAGDQLRSVLGMDHTAETSLIYVGQHVRYIAG